MRTVVRISLFCVCCLCVVANASWAQDAQNAVQEMENAVDETEEMATEAEMYFASGTVVEASDTQIVISEYDFDAGQEANVAYQINAQTQLEGVSGVADFKAGDDIEIEYQLTGDQKIATRIEKYAPESDMETMEDVEEPVSATEAVSGNTLQ